MKTRSRHVILREKDFVPLLQEASSTFGGIIQAILDDEAVLERQGVCDHLSEVARQLETGLDDVGCRQNRKFSTFREMVASIRWISHVASIEEHISARLSRYSLQISTKSLEKDLEEAEEILRAALQALCEAISEEAGRLGVTWEVVEVAPREEIVPTALLPRDAGQTESIDERQHLAQIAAKYLRVLEASRGLSLDEVRPREELSEYVAEYATESRCRVYESSVHNIQSIYDTAVLNTSLESENPWLQVLRGHVSVSFHLLEAATNLVHFVERHEEGAMAHEPAREAISDVVAREDILHVAVNLCLRPAYLFIEGAADVAERTLSTFVAQGSAVLPMPDGVILHARPLALIAQIARHYGTPVEIYFDDENCSAASLMSLIMLGGRNPRPKKIEARGDVRTLRDLEDLFAAGLGETGELPPSLEYLQFGS